MTTTMMMDTRTITATKGKSIVNESEELQLAITLIKLGARLQLLESQTKLSREKLIKLYKELKGISPPKGMLPFSADWFLTWLPNIHSSIFMNVYQFLNEYSETRGIQLTIKAYKLYLEQINHTDINEEPVLSFTRAWTLTRFMDSKILGMKKCSCCHGQFVVNTYDLHKDYRCSLCHVPSRAGKTKKSKEIMYNVV